MKLVTDGEIKESKEGGTISNFTDHLFSINWGGGVVLGFFWDYRASGVDQINFMVTQPKILQLTPPSNI